MKTIKHWIFLLGAWLIHIASDPARDPDPIVETTDPLRELARTLVKRQDEKWPERDGECKRAAVYAQMVNSYPNRSKREISRMIEDAVCGES